MKILHVETGRHFLGGPQQVIYLINALRDRGHDNTLVCPPDSGVDGVARQAGIRVQNLFCAGDLDLPFAYRLSQYLKEVAPDIVHCHSRRGADILGGLAASFADIPTVVSRRVDNTEMRLMAALRYRPFKKVIAISNAIAEVLLDRGVEANRLTIIRDAVDVTTFDSGLDCRAFRREFSLADDDFVIAAAGQLIPRKGHRFLLQAVAEIKDRYPQLKLLIFGEGYLNNQLRAQAASLQLGDVVQFAGFRADLDSFFACFDLFAHPALAEGLGVAALKAAAASVPVVGFSAGGMTEAVLHGETGVLVAPEDADALADAIRQFIEEPERRRHYGAAGRRRMQDEFSIDTMVDKHLALYEAVLNGQD
ncbi:MAG: glycosyltransferase [Gammaproteobacteria bacterium]|nr:glycosyltransferase [Gammaproteobacteria bacterium]MBU2677645.1 glycosyltransferase [Gammaproteobacteria bacterium]NNL51377.1 glycosyltransferase [Woeseiaceae bacterium]